MYNIGEIAALVSNAMVGAVDANRKAFIHMDDLESVYESWFDMLAAPSIPKWDYTTVYGTVYNHEETQLAFNVMKGMIDEERSEAKEAIIRSQNPMQYYGLKQSDFI